MARPVLINIATPELSGLRTAAPIGKFCNASTALWSYTVVQLHCPQVLL